MKSCCTECGKELIPDEIGLHRKLINRGADSFLCFSCLARRFNTGESDLIDLVERLRTSGCSLFPKNCG